MNPEQVTSIENSIHDEVFEPISSSTTVPNMSFQLDELLRQHSESAGNWVEVVDDEIQQSATYRDLIVTDGVTRSQTEPSLNSLPQTNLPTKPPFVAYVSGLNFCCMEPDVYFLFGGRERILDIVLNYNNGRFNGDCLIEFKTQTDLNKALALNGTKFFGRKIRVSLQEVPQISSNFNNYAENTYDTQRNRSNRQYDGRGSYDSTNSYSSRYSNERYSNEKSSSRSSAQSQDNYYNQNQPNHQQQHQRYPKFAPHKRESNDVRRAHDYNMLQMQYSTRSRNDSMTSNQSTLERPGRRIQTPRSTISQAGSELSLADSTTVDYPHRKMDVFGGAKPADNKDKMLEYEEKMRREREAHAKKMKEDKEREMRSKIEQKERQITPETASVPGQIKILQKEKRVYQDSEELSSRRETRDSYDSEFQEDVKKEPLSTQISVTTTASETPPQPPLNRKYSDGKRIEKHKTTYTFYNTTRGGHGRGRGAHYKHNTELLGHQRGDKYLFRDRHRGDKKFTKTPSDVVSDGAKEQMDGTKENVTDDTNNERRHSVTTSDMAASGKPPKAEPPRKDSYQGQEKEKYGRHGHVKNDDRGYGRGGHGGRDGTKRPHKIFDENYSRSSSDPSQFKRFPRKLSGKGSRKGSMDEQITPGTDNDVISIRKTSGSRTIPEKVVLKSNDHEIKPIKSASVDDDRQDAGQKSKETTPAENMGGRVEHEQVSSEPATPVFKNSGGGGQQHQPTTPETSAKKKVNKKQEKIKEMHKKVVSGNKYSALLDAEHD